MSKIKTTDIKKPKPEIEPDRAFALFDSARYSAHFHNGRVWIFHRMQKITTGKDGLTTRTFEIERFLYATWNPQAKSAQAVKEKIDEAIDDLNNLCRVKYT